MDTCCQNCRSHPLPRKNQQQKCRHQKCAGLQFDYFCHAFPNLHNIPRASIWDKFSLHTPKTGKKSGKDLTISGIFIIIHKLTGCGEVWYRAWFGSKRPRVRIPTLRPWVNPNRVYPFLFLEVAYSCATEVLFSPMVVRDKRLNTIRRNKNGVYLQKYPRINST